MSTPGSQHPSQPSSSPNPSPASAPQARSKKGPAPRPKGPSAPPPPRLSCIACRSRKVKCDRLLPCAPCQRSGLTCVFPQPAPPRPRTGAKAKSEEIQGRLSRLESLVGAMGGERAVEARAREEKERRAGRGVHGPRDGEGEGAVREEADENEQEQVEEPKERKVDDVLRSEGGRWVGGDFWSNLSVEVDGLRDLLNEPDEEGDEDDRETSDSPSASPEAGSGNSPGTSFIFQSAEGGTIDLTNSYPYPPSITLLFETYFNRFDPTFKVLHKPSSYTIFASISYDVNRPAIKGGQEALVFAIFYAAITCSTVDECFRQFHEERSILVKRYEKAVEAALTNADFINSGKLVTLQAYVIYLACYRSHHETRTAWTLLAVAVRIAYALDLHCDGGLLQLPVYEVEMRRRLFWQIVFLDVQASEDRGSIPMVMEHWFDTRMPSNINDEDLDPKLGLTREEHVGCTEMTFSLICHEASRALQILAAQQPRRRTFVPVYTPSQEDRERRVNDVSQRLHSRFIVHCDTRVPFDWFCSMVSQIIILKFFLLSYYPVFTRSNAPPEPRSANFPSADTHSMNKHPPPRISRPSQTSLLSSSVSLLELQHRLEHSRLSWAWIAKNFVQWHPLAVTLATLCSLEPGSTPLIERAWAIVDTVYDEWSAHVADSRDGKLWKPISRLRDRARERHGRASKSKSPESAGGGSRKSSGQAGLGDMLGIQNMALSDPPVTMPSSMVPGSGTGAAMQAQVFDFNQGMEVDSQLYNQSIAMALDAPWQGGGPGMGAGGMNGVAIGGNVPGMDAGLGFDGAMVNIPGNWAEWEKFLEGTGEGLPIM